MKKVIVIGGGASGMAAAYAASLSGASVTLLEQNEKLGKKVYITGKGRCNCTNAADMETVRNAVVSNPKFMYSAFNAFSNTDLIRFLERFGCPTKIERGNRVFPVSDHASDVIRAFERALLSQHVSIRYGAKVRALMTEAYDGTDPKKKTPEKRVCGVTLSNGEKLLSDAVILASGGVSYPLTGADGSGLRIAEEEGHRITPLYPSLVSLHCSDPWVAETAGLSLKNAAIRITGLKKNRVLYEDFGELLFTHRGVSGPVILSASAYLTGILNDEKFRDEKAGDPGIVLYIDLKPALTEEQLDARILRDFSRELNKHFRNALGGLLPSSLTPVVVGLSGIDPEKSVNSITKEERKHLIRVLKGLPMHIDGTGGFEEAIVTHGGVSVKDIDPSTMESKRVKDLYFAGEMIDVDALTGGFNLQIAWSTGYLAGMNAGKEEEKRMSINVAIDGPAGAGKSTVAKRIAKELQYIYVDTGAMYRAIGLYFLNHGIDILDEEACAAALPDIDVTIGHEDGAQQVFLNGENVSGLIRTQEVGEAASKTSAYQAVRAKLLDLQRSLAKKNDVLMDGRDIGTMILPNADVKIFLTASSYVRAKRRFDELQAKGEACVLEEIQKEIEERDYRDSHREIAPLRQAEDAIVVDTSALNIDEVVAKIIGIIREKTGNGDQNS